MAVKTNAAKMARVLAVIQIITGVLLFAFGIADRRVEGGTYWEFTGYFYFGIWTGIWMCITGGLGIPGSGREGANSQNAFAGVFMGFSITSALMGAAIIICYSIGLYQLTDDNYRYYYTYYHYTKLGRTDNYWDSYNYRGKMAIISIMLILGIVTFGIGIWAAICTCLMKPCTCCCKQPQADQQMHSYPNGGYIMTQMSGGVPVAVPMQAMQAGGGGAAAQRYHKPMVQVPVSGASGGQQLIVQAASLDGMAMGQQQQRQGKFRHERYEPQQDWQMQVYV